MENTRLSKNEIKQLMNYNRKVKTKSKSDRIRCLIYWGKGWSWKQIKEALFISDATIKSYLDKYKAGGIDELLSVHYEGNNNKLTEKQEDIIREYVKDKSALTTEDVCDFVKDHFGIQYTTNGMVKTLTRLGFTYREMEKEAYEVDPYLQGIHYGFSYIDKVINQKKDESIYFINAGKVLYSPNLSYGWIVKKHIYHKETLNIEVEANIAYDLKTNEVITSKIEGADDSSIKTLLKKIFHKNSNTRQITIMVYNASKSKLRTIKSFIKKYAKDISIELIEVPPYKPRLHIDSN